MQRLTENRAEDRLERLTGGLAAVSVEDHSGCLALAGPLIGVTSSRLGHRTDVHRHAGRFLKHCALDCRSRSGTLLVAEGSAVEGWAVRAAELFAVPLVKLIVNGDIVNGVDVGNDCSGHPWIHIRTNVGSRTRDEVLVALADRVDVVHVRRNGNIAKAVHQRVHRMTDGSTRVAISPQSNCDAVRFIDSGAVGWLDPNEWLSSDDRSAFDPAVPNRSVRLGKLWCQEDWANDSGRWLIHCSRAPKMLWPDETVDQYRDSLLLGGDGVSTNRQSIDSLCRIVRGGRLVASAIASSRSHPVVCFTEVGLMEVLARRCFRQHLGRWDYEPFGVAIKRSAAEQLGIQPVVYGPPSKRATMDADQKFRFQALGNTNDWQAEREWRSSRSIDLSQFDDNEVKVFALHSEDAESKLSGCPYPVTWIKKKELASKI